eukprot:scaffold7379_cov126-Isochrysis_galbana.AAC.6
MIKARRTCPSRRFTQGGVLGAVLDAQTPHLRAPGPIWGRRADGLPAGVLAYFGDGGAGVPELAPAGLIGSPRRHRYLEGGASRTRRHARTAMWRLPGKRGGAGRRD